MVLHLLGKKSWNVYNRANVERVRRDEAEARAREEADEQRLQSRDAERRLALLRGEQPPVPDGNRSDERLSPPVEHTVTSSRPRKRRRLHGEDDTARDIRHAREDAEAGQKARLRLGRREVEDAPLQDQAGHIQLFAAPDDTAIRQAHKNEEAEAEKARMQKRAEDQYTMRFSNAAGFDKSLAKPWYADQNTAVALESMPQKDVWGRQDPRRQERERNRISTNDPLAAMQHAQRQLKQSEHDRASWKKQRQLELEPLTTKHDSHRRSHRKSVRRRESDADSLEGFSLDATKDTEREKHRKQHHHRHRTSRNRSRSRSPGHHHRHHSHVDRERK